MGVSYISPSQVLMWLNNAEEYYVNYGAEVRRFRDPQNEAMAIGSAFDALLKNKINEDLGQPVDSGIYDRQVEEHMRDIVRWDAEWLLQEYVELGAYNDLMTDFRESDGGVRMQDRVEGVIEGVPMLGYPDAEFFVDGKPVVLDFKVNGYYSSRPVSPAKGYLRQASGDMRYHRRPHKNCREQLWAGKIRYNSAVSLDQVDKKWAVQTVMYGWLLGVPVGVEMLAGIEQLCNSGKGLRVAQHRCVVPADFGIQVLGWCRKIWEMQSGEIEWCDVEGRALDVESLDRQISGMNAFRGW